MRKLLAAAAILAIAPGCTFFKAVFPTSATAVVDQSSNAGAVKSACGLTATQQSVTCTPNSLGGVNATATCSFSAEDGVVSIPATCLNDVSVPWQAIGTPSGACSIQGNATGLSATIIENAAGTCAVSAAPFPISPGQANLTLQ